MKTPVVELACCILCEVCIELAPNVFKLNQTGFIEVIPANDYSDESIVEAVKNCPRGCIGWEIFV